MSTPTYKGNAQPTANSGLLSGLGSWFGGGTPAYAGAGQPTSASSRYLGTSAPAYQQAAAATAPQAEVACSEPERITIVIPRELIDSQS